MTESEMAQWFLKARSEGDDDAWGVLLVSLAEHFYRMLDRRGIDRHLAEDVIQESLLAFWSRSPDLRTPGRCRAWANSIVMNRLRSTITRRPRDSGGLDDLEPPASQPEPCEMLMKEEAARWIEEQLAHMPSEAAAIRLSFHEGLGSSEASLALGVTSRSFRRILSRGLNRLRRRMESQEGTWVPQAMGNP